MTATPTYSQSITGAGVGAVVGGVTPANNILVGDTSVDGVALSTAAGQGQAVRLGSPVLCKGPDGALHWYKIRGGGGGGNAVGSNAVLHPILEYVGP